jgi:hypothetical protein
MNPELPTFMKYKLRRRGEVSLQKPDKSSSGYTSDNMKTLIDSISIDPVAVPDATKTFSLL